MIHPCGPILLSEMSTFTRVLLTNNAPANASAPMSPMRLPARFISTNALGVIMMVMKSGGERGDGGDDEGGGMIVMMMERMVMVVVMMRRRGWRGGEGMRLPARFISTNALGMIVITIMMRGGDREGG